MPPQERLTRYLFLKDHFDSRPGKRLVKQRAFKLDDGEAGVSTFKTGGLSWAEIWSHGSEWAANGRALLARGDFVADSAFKLGLRLVPSNSPPRHVDLMAWPTDEAKQLSIRQQLARGAKLHLPDDEPSDEGADR